ncbi:hypothetical protein MML48_1g14209 [Holotrichia oblita]|uniref:Uncharacterized protein n=1 Tax=Holotrichia oblita TaxID=644536 RepID=A0ACB9TSQ5_HOLOL|nr:hypothetical protein MML48_1g14209 [Holotrichia oblita]
MGIMRRAIEDLNITSDQNLDEFIKIDDNTPTEDDDFENQTTTSSQDGKQNHVSFPEFQQNGTAKQFTHDYINEVLHEDDTEPKSSKEEWDSPITFTAKSSRVDLMRVTTPTATESVLPWKRDDETEGSAPLQQSEFPAWASNKEYLAYNSPSATFLGGLDYPRSSVIGLFRRESTGSAQISSAESSPRKERRGSAGMNAILLIEEGTTDPLGVLQKPGGAQSQTPTTTAAPQTPSQRRQARRGSMLELSGCVDDTSNTSTR